MGNKISIEFDGSEEIKDIITYKNARKLKQQYIVDLRKKRMDFDEYNKKMEKIEQFIEYYKSKYNI